MKFPGVDDGGGSDVERKSLSRLGLGVWLLVLLGLGVWMLDLCLCASSSSWISSSSCVHMLGVMALGVMAYLFCAWAEVAAGRGGFGPSSSGGSDGCLLRPKCSGGSLGLDRSLGMEVFILTHMDNDSCKNENVMRNDIKTQCLLSWS